MTIWPHGSSLCYATRADPQRAAQMLAELTVSDLNLEPIIWPEGDEYCDPALFRAHERFWWHASIARELRTQAEQGRPASCVKSIAGNIKMSTHDVARYIRQMLTWGELVKAAPLFDFEPKTWVALAEEPGSSAVKAAGLGQLPRGR